MRVVRGACVDHISFLCIAGGRSFAAASGARRLTRNPADAGKAHSSVKSETSERLSLCPTASASWEGTCRGDVEAVRAGTGDQIRVTSLG